MKIIAFYVSDLGFGHLTRSLALIEQILELSEYGIYLVCGEMQIDYAKVFLHEYEGRVHYSCLNTETKISVVDNSFEFDIEQTKDNISIFLGSMEEKIKHELDSIQELDVALIVTDISIVGIYVAKRLGIKVIGITNYTNYHRFVKMGIENELIQPYLDAYNQLDVLYEYAYADDMSNITCPKEQVGMVARIVNHIASSDFRTRYWPSCFISIGQVANRDSITVDFQAGHIFATGNIHIEGNSHVMTLPRRVGHSQDYVDASSLALIKPGWSSVAECMTSGTPFGVLDVNHIEDGEIIQKLKKDDICFVLNQIDFGNIDVKELNMLAAKRKYKKIKNDSNFIAWKLMGQIE